MKTQWAVYILTFSLTLGACSKPGEQSQKIMDHTEVQGRLLDASTLEPIAYGTIKIYQAPCPAAFGAFGEFMETTTDENGFYSLSFEHKASQCYDIVAYADHYFTNENKGPGTQYPLARASGQSSLSKGKINTRDIKIAPVGWINLRVKNLSKEFYTLSLNPIAGSSKGISGISGYDIDKTFKFYTYGNIASKLYIFLYEKNSGAENYKLRVDSLHTLAHDTTYYELIY